VPQQRPGWVCFPELLLRQPDGVLIVDDTGFLKDGKMPSRNPLSRWNLTMNHGEINTRRPSWQHLLAANLLQLTGMSRRTPEKLHASIAKRDAKWTPPKPPARLLAGIQARWSDDVGWPVWTLSADHETGESRGAVIGVHGGGYTSEVVRLHWAFYASVVRETGCDVIVPIYPLAPHGTAATVVPIVADLIAEQVQSRGADRVGVQGDSAGAGLALAAVQELVRRGAEVPARMVLISPWLDATVSDPRSRSVHDPMLNVDGLAEAGRLWAGALQPSDPLASPIHGSLKGLPDTWVYSGSLDILFPDSLRLRERAEAENVDIHFDLRKGLVHVWPAISFIPEAKEVREPILHQLTGRG
jgi:triacylglycerol lipase